MTVCHSERSGQVDWMQADITARRPVTYGFRRLWHDSVHQFPLGLSKEHSVGLQGVGDSVLLACG